MDLQFDNARRSGFDLLPNIAKVFELVSNYLIELLTKTFEVFDLQVCKLNC